jgi:hypothetical protein
MSRYIADSNGGTCSRIIDFSNGPDEAPEPKMVTLPQWPGYLAHTRHGDWRIWLDSSEVYYPDAPVDMRCGSCTPRSEIGLNHEDQEIIFLVHHQPGCQAIEDRLAMAGVR